MFGQTVQKALRTLTGKSKGAVLIPAMPADVSGAVASYLADVARGVDAHPVNVPGTDRVAFWRAEGPAEVLATLERALAERFAYLNVRRDGHAVVIEPAGAAFAR